MSEIRTFRFFIPPQPHIRTTENENWMFAPGIDDAYLKKFGEKKYQQRVAKKSKNPGTPNNYFNRKNRILKYWDYKRALKILADEQKFIMPIEGAHIRFFIGMPKSWAKKKKNEKCFTLMGSKPDLDNLVKGYLDSLMVEDESICDYRASKHYYSGSGYIEVTIGELPPANGYSKYVREDKIK
jgi:Holliday junction resolvase RusA-like endonuclease